MSMRKSQGTWTFYPFSIPFSFTSVILYSCQGKTHTSKNFPGPTPPPRPFGRPCKYQSRHTKSKSNSHTSSRINVLSINPTDTNKLICHEYNYLQTSAFLNTNETEVAAEAYQKPISTIAFKLRLNKESV